MNRSVGVFRRPRDIRRRKPQWLRALPAYALTTLPTAPRTAINNRKYIQAHMDIGDYKVDDTIDFFWTTADASDLPVAPSAGTVKVYKDGDAASEVVTGVTDTRTFDSITGLHHVQIDLSADSAFYSSGSNFAVVIIDVVVDGNQISAPLALFSIENRSVNPDSVLQQVLTGNRIERPARVLRPGPRGGARD